MNTGTSSPQVQSVVAEVLPTLLVAIKEEGSKEGVANAITSLSKYLLTRACPDGSWQEAAAVVGDILQGQAMCQATDSDAIEWEDEEEDDKEVAYATRMRSIAQDSDCCNETCRVQWANASTSHAALVWKSGWPLQHVIDFQSCLENQAIARLGEGSRSSQVPFRGHDKAGLALLRRQGHCAVLKVC